MEIQKYCHHRGELEDLSQRYSIFEAFKDTVDSGFWHEWIHQETNERTHEKLVIFLGKTGYGKSSTVNAILGVNHLETSAVAACTRMCQCFDFRIDGKYWLSLGDLPGVGENNIRDKEYFALYKEFIKYASVIVHVIRADARDYSIDQELTQTLLGELAIKKRVIYALGQCDKVEPVSRAETRSPTAPQHETIENKILEVKRSFQPKNTVVPYSAATGWNLGELTKEIVRVALVT